MIIFNGNEKIKYVSSGICFDRNRLADNDTVKLKRKVEKEITRGQKGRSIVWYFLMVNLRNFRQ